MFRPILFLILSLFGWLNCSTVNAIEWHFSFKPTETENLIRRINPRTGVMSIAFNPNGQWLASGSEDGVVRLWSLTDEKREEKRFTGHLGAISSVVFSPDSQLLASAALEDEKIHLWNVAQGREIKLLQGHTGPVLSLAFSPDGKYLASGSQDRTMIVWEVSQGQLFRQYNEHTEGVTHVAFSPDGQWLASASWDSKVYLWNWQTGEIIQTFEHKDSVFDIAFSPDDQWLASGGDDKTVHLWNTKTGLEKGVFSKRKAEITSIAFSPDGNLLISSAGDNTVCVEYLAEEKKPEPLELYDSQLPKVVFNKEGTILAVSTGNGSIQLYNMQTRKIQHLFVVGGNEGDWLSCDMSSQQCLKSYLVMGYWFAISFATMGALLFFITYYYFRIYRHPLVTSLSADAQNLLTLPLPQLAKAQRLLRRTYRLNSILISCQIPTETFKDAIAFAQATPLQQTEILAKRWSARWEQKTEDLFVICPPDYFPLNLTRCILYFPAPDKLPATILEQLHYNEELKLEKVIIITLALNQQLTLRPYGEDTTTLWVVPNDRELTQWLLAIEPLTVIAQTLATQLQVTQISPYQTWGGVTKDTVFFGRTQILAHILNRDLSNYLIVGGRQIGKSSLLKYLERYYRRQPDVICHYLQLSHDRVVEKLATELQLSDQSSLEEVLNYLLHAKQRHLFLIDEADKWIHTEMQQNYPTLTGLRSLSEEGHSYFILAGFWNLYRATILDYHSPVKNFGEIITLAELEEKACHNLIVKPLHSLNIQVASEALIEKLIYATGQRANLIALVCNEMLKNLDVTTRTLGKEQVMSALNSKAVLGALSSWGQLTSDSQASHLDRLIVYATIQEGEFTVSSLLKILESYGDYSLEAIKHSVERLTLGFVIRQNARQYYTYCVPLFREKLLQENIKELLPVTEMIDNHY
ncbi:MAG: hypothetical protein BWK78_01060 [Thiotrichaceae bacterium IS1]|nr:MAG: hypothetical protein BWK78_01060 [Thiotrichaceae bacterium IS1]